MIIYRIQQYPGTVKVDYSRLRESGVRTAFENFDFKITGESVINIRAIRSISYFTRAKSCNN